MDGQTVDIDIDMAALGLVECPKCYGDCHGQGNNLEYYCDECHGMGVK